MSLFNIIKGILNIQKKIEVHQLPSQGFFYKSDFEIYIKKADLEDIIEYEHKYDKEDLGIVVTRLKKIVEKNVVLANGHSYNDIKSTLTISPAESGSFSDGLLGAQVQLADKSAD